MSFIEASARHNLYVAEVFNTLAQKMYERKKNGELPITIPTIKIPPGRETPQKDRKSACKC